MAVDAQIIDGRTTMDLAKDGRFLPDPRVAELLQDYGVAGLHLSKDKNKLAAEHQAAMRAAAKQGEWRPLTLAVRIPTAATHSAISILGLLWTSLSVHEVPWQLAYVTVRCFSLPDVASAGIDVATLLVLLLVPCSGVFVTHAVAGMLQPAPVPQKISRSIMHALTRCACTATDLRALRGSVPRAGTLRCRDPFRGPLVGFRLRHPCLA